MKVVLATAAVAAAVTLAAPPAVADPGLGTGSSTGSAPALFCGILSTIDLLLGRPVSPPCNGLPYQP